MPRLSRDRTVAVGQVRGSLTCAGDPYFSSTSRIRSIPQCGLSCFRRAHCIYPDFGRHGAPSWLEQTSDALILRARARMASMPYQDGSENSVALRPDVIFAPGLSMVVARTQTQTVPIVFTQTTAPVERGFVASLARPGGNITGFTNFEPSIGGKWLGLLKEVAPKLARSATMFNPEGAPHAPFLQRSIEEASQALGITTIAAPVRTDADVDNVVASLAQDGDGALIVIPDPFTIAHRQAIIRAAATDRVPTMYSYRAFVDDGGLMGYSADIPEQYRGAANYVDRILKGAKPADLPVQAPTKYELVINLKTARAISLDIPPTLLARADGVIE
jgi:putative ABC transport system substrate-binding protein